MSGPMTAREAHLEIVNASLVDALNDLLTRPTDEAARIRARRVLGEGAGIVSDEARRRSAVAYDCIVSALRRLQLMDSGTRRIMERAPHLFTVSPLHHGDAATDDLVRAGRILLGEIEP